MILAPGLKAFQGQRLQLIYPELKRQRIKVLATLGPVVMLVTQPEPSWIAKYSKSLGPKIIIACW